MTPVPPLPPAPVLPPTLTITTLVSYAFSLAAFALGLLTFAGVTIPAGVTHGIQTWSAVALTVAGVVAGIVTQIRHHQTVLAFASLNSEQKASVMRSLR